MINKTILTDLMNHAVGHVVDTGLTVRDDDIVATVDIIYNKSFGDFGAMDEFLTDDAIRKAEEAKDRIAEALDKVYTEEWENEFRPGQFNPNPTLDPNNPQNWGPQYAKSQGISESEIASMKKRLTDPVAASEKDDLAVSQKYKNQYRAPEKDTAVRDREAKGRNQETEWSKATITDILNNHPLHRLAHDLDDSGEMFDWSKCPSSIDLDFVPTEVMEEVRRRHGQNYYPHVHADQELINNPVYYDKSATNIIQEEFSELHETLHRTDHHNFLKGEMGGHSQIYEQIANGAFLNHAGGSMSNELIEHVQKSHGANWDQHMLLVPVIKAYDPEMTTEDAVRGGGWDVYPFPFQRGLASSVKPAVDTVDKLADVAMIGNAIPHPVAQVVGKAGTIAKTATSAIKPMIDSAAASEAKKNSNTKSNITKAQEGATPPNDADADAPTSSDDGGDEGPGKAEKIAQIVMQLFQKAMEKSGGDQQKALEMTIQALSEQAGIPPDQAKQVVVQTLQQAGGAQGGATPEQGDAEGEEQEQGGGEEQEQGGGEEQEEAPLPKTDNNAPPAAANNPAEMKKADSGVPHPIGKLKKKDVRGDTPALNAKETKFKPHHGSGLQGQAPATTGHLKSMMDGFEVSRMVRTADDDAGLQGILSDFFKGTSDEHQRELSQKIIRQKTAKGVLDKNVRKTMAKDVLNKKVAENKAGNK